MQSSPRASSPVNSPTVGTASGRPSSPTPPGGPKTAIRRRAAADQKDKLANARPSSTRAAGAGGSSSTMLSMCSSPLMVVIGFGAYRMDLGPFANVTAGRKSTERKQQESSGLPDFCRKGIVHIENKGNKSAGDRIFANKTL